MFTDRIYPGTYIDNVQVDGMTREEAVRAVSAVHQDQGRAFDITVCVGNESWHVNSERVPVSRNTEEIVERAWASGRSNTANLGAGDTTPFQERVRTLSERVDTKNPHPVTFATVQDYDHEALRLLTDGIVNYVNRDPVNSVVQSFDFNTKTFSFTEDKPGARLDPDGLYNQLTEILDSGVTRKEVWVVP